MTAQPMKAATRRRRNREEMVDAILQTSRDIMREEGAAALNLHEVARRLGIKTPSLYYYFNDKMAIYDVLFRRGILLFESYLDDVYESTANVWDQICMSLRAYMQFAQDHPDLYQIVFERPVPGFVPSEESMAESWRVLEKSRKQVGKLVTSRQIEPHVPDVAAGDLLIAMMHGLTALHMANEPHLPVGEGRFGSLLPAAAKLFERAWRPGTDASNVGDVELAEKGEEADPQ